MLKCARREVLHGMIGVVVNLRFFLVRDTGWIVVSAILICSGGEMVASPRTHLRSRARQRSAS